MADERVPPRRANDGSGEERAMLSIGLLPWRELRGARSANWPPRSDLTWPSANEGSALVAVHCPPVYLLDKTLVYRLD